MSFLTMQEEKALILKSYDVTHLLLSLSKHERLFDDNEIMKKLEDIVKAVFYSKGVLNPSGEQFVKFLLVHQRHDFNKLGIFSLYCIALGLQDKESERNFRIFHDDQVLNTLVLFAKDKSRSSAMSNNTMQKMV